MNRSDQLPPSSRQQNAAPNLLQNGLVLITDENNPGNRLMNIGTKAAAQPRDPDDSSLYLNTSCDTAVEEARRTIQAANRAKKQKNGRGKRGQNSARRQSTRSQKRKRRESAGSLNRFKKNAGATLSSNASQPSRNKAHAASLAAQAKGITLDSAKQRQSRNLIDDVQLEQIAASIEGTYRQRMEQARGQLASNLNTLSSRTSNPNNGADGATLSGRLPENSEQLMLSQKISSYRFKRLKQQQELERLQALEDREKEEMQRRLETEQQAYNEARQQLEKLRVKVKKMKKKNRQEARTKKQVDVMLNRDFYKWTNSFSRKSVHWVESKEALLEDVIRQEADARTSRSPSKRKDKGSRSPAQVCCGSSPERYGHQQLSDLKRAEESYQEVKTYMHSLERQMRH